MTTVLPSPSPTHALWDVGAPVIQVVWHALGVGAAITGDGHVLLLKEDSTLPLAVPCHAGDGALLSVIVTPEGFVVGGDDGGLTFVSPEGEKTLLARFSGQFLEHLAYDASSRLLMVGKGRFVVLMNLSGHVVGELGPFPSTVAGLAVSPLGGRLAVAHYGGVSVANLNNRKIPPRVLEWKGSHGALTYAPNGKWLISAMQDAAIHLWRLSDDMDLHMRGYPSKVRTFAWDDTGTQLMTDGGPGVPVWNFKDPIRGPGGQQARMLADSGSDEVLVTAVAHHPKGPFLAIGYGDGLVVLLQTATEQSVLLMPPSEPVVPVETLAWSHDGLTLLAGMGTTLVRVAFRDALPVQ